MPVTKKSLYIILLAAIIAGSFLAGSWHSRREGSRGNTQGERRVLYYVDPMNPAHTSDKPGLAPCGMQMEPVFADDKAGKVPASLPRGTVRISPEKQQLIGVKVARVEKSSGTHALRILGRVVPDENRLYRLNASTELWVRKVYPPTTGSVVKKDELLLSFYTTNFFSAAQGYMYALNTWDRQRAAKMDSPAQTEVVKYQIRQAIENLQNLGVSDTQIAEMERTRKVSDLVDVRSPATGFVLERNVTLGEWVRPGSDMYRIADLRQVWILADLFENEAHYFRPGAMVRVSLPHQRKSFHARVSDVLPLFDPATRTMKVRLETENPGYVLRPDMFVDVEVPIRFPPAIAVPADAVLDSGLRKTVFVDLGNGFFEPRQVETGWRMGDRVEVVRGLTPGERIVVSGNFLIDSESRMKMAAAGIFGSLSKDPVCGMDVDESRARAAGRMSEHRGKTYYFCMDECKKMFDNDPAHYAEKGTGAGRPVAASGAGEGNLEKDPVCGMYVVPAVAAKAGRVSGYRGKTYYFCADVCKDHFVKTPGRYVKE